MPLHHLHKSARAAKDAGVMETMNAKSTTLLTGHINRTLHFRNFFYEEPENCTLGPMAGNRVEPWWAPASPPLIYVAATNAGEDVVLR